MRNANFNGEGLNGWINGAKVYYDDKFKSMIKKKLSVYFEQIHKSILGFFIKM